MLETNQTCIFNKTNRNGVLNNILIRHIHTDLHNYLTGRRVKEILYSVCGYIYSCCDGPFVQSAVEHYTVRISFHCNTPRVVVWSTNQCKYAGLSENSCNFLLCQRTQICMNVFEEMGSLCNYLLC